MSPPIYQPASLPRGASPARYCLWFIVGLSMIAGGPRLAAAPAAAAPPPPTLETDGFVLVATPSAGAQLAYTLNGVDPRGPDGFLGLGAQLTSRPLAVGAGTPVVARTFSPVSAALSLSAWSAARTAADARLVTAGTNPLFAARLTNLSTLVCAGCDEATAITGFVVDGDSDRPLLIRAVGPALRAFGVGNALPDPVVIVCRADGSEVIRASGWTADPVLPMLTASVGAFPLPDASADTALALRLPPGAYTLQIASSSGAVGAVLAEVYDLERARGFACLSTRAQVCARRPAFTGGFSVQGTTPRRLLIRAVGPGLAAYGVDATVTDPVLEVFAGLESIALNDDWKPDAATQAAVAACGAFPLNVGSRDASLLLVLPPGSYTARASAKDGATGVVLLEIYPVP